MSDNPAAASKGLKGVVAASTHLSDVQGEEGVLIYSGYNINELAGNATYEEVVHLLHYGHLPNVKELADLKKLLIANRELPSGVVEILRLLPRDTTPMHALRTAVSALGCFDPHSDDSSLESNRRMAMQLIAKIPVIVTSFHNIRSGRPVVAPSKTLGEAANFLYMINGSEPSEEMTKTMDVCYILHADHGMNASTFSARVTIATLSDMYSAITSAIGTLKGPLHGGANEGVIKMLQEIGNVEGVDAYVKDCLEHKKKVMGIGHAVYKTLDPRAPHLKAMAQKLSSKLGEPKWIQMSERIADIMKREKGLNANVDFYSATVYYSLGIPIDLFTPIFAIARVTGWTAHMIEQLSENRLIRPQSEYVGQHDLKFVPIEKR